ncbi:hypothetical protein PG993_003481 [Apiospora rasikravindrae]|uniref:Mitochondrial genome maintenance protein MGM101 n=1 Tax=Apiospora rasikravindrae TaxID=990691 RepID=A0ABR1TZM9_9PEZI
MSWIQGKSESSRPELAVSGVPLPDASSTTDPNSNENPIDWSLSYHGAPLDAVGVEVKPDGIIYLLETKYRRVPKYAFGPGGWDLAPREDFVV